METETLRPEFQNLAPHGDTPRHEVLEPAIRQLKQEPTANHEHLGVNPDAPNPTTIKNPEPDRHVASPASDDPTTDMDDVSESLQNPKPSSFSTHPTSQLEKPLLQDKQLPCSPVRTPSEEPQAPVNTPPHQNHKKLPIRSNAVRLRRPLTAPYEEGESSDEDEDFRRYYRTMFRRKNESEMTETIPHVPVVDHSKKGRNTRQSTGKVQKRKSEDVREIPFSDPKYHKTVGPMVLRPSDIARDLAAIYGREYKETPAECPKPPVHPNERKRHRGSETPSGGNGLPHAKRYRQTNTNSSDTVDNSAVADVGRSTRYAKRVSAQVASSSADRACQISNKRQKMTGGNATMTEVDQKKMFEKHPERKGWVVCKKCEAAVWPPNCGKHLFHCRKL